jgi:hypothetical protein
MHWIVLFVLWITTCLVGRLLFELNEICASDAEGMVTCVCVCVCVFEGASGSPNYVRQVYNASSGAAPRVTWQGNIFIQNLYTAYWDSHGLQYAMIAFDGRSDYEGFIEANVPAGGIATGAEVLKTMPERTTYGGFANAQLDPCYHQSCDTVENVDGVVLGQMARSAASVVYALASNENLRVDLGRPRNF